MNLALCNAIPRDGFVLLALLLLVASVIVEAIAIGQIKSETAAGEFRDGSQSTVVLAYLSAHPTVYAADKTSQLCHSRSAVLTFHCARFSEAYHTMNGLILASFISTVVAWVVCFCVIGRYASSTLTLLWTIIVAVSLPTSLQCAVVGVFFARVVGNARKDLEQIFGVSKVVFHRHAATNLMIAATALMCAALVLVWLRFLLTCVTARRLQHTSNPSKEEVDRMMRLHLVNDDWLRQKQVLRSHAMSVQVEMQIRKDDETFLEPGAHQHHHDRAPNVRFVRRSRGSSFVEPPPTNGEDFSVPTEPPLSDFDVPEPRNKRLPPRGASPDRDPHARAQSPRIAFEPMDESDVEL